MALRSSPIRRKPRPDPVTPTLHAAVLLRDRECVQHKLEPEHRCQNIYGQTHGAWMLEWLQLDHVQDGGGRMGKRAPSDMAHLVSLCAGAHLNGWATSHRPELRAYLADEHVHVDPVPGCPRCHWPIDFESGAA